MDAPYLLEDRRHVHRQLHNHHLGKGAVKVDRHQAQARADQQHIHKVDGIVRLANDAPTGLMVLDTPEAEDIEAQKNQQTLAIPKAQSAGCYPGTRRQEELKDYDPQGRPQAGEVSCSTSPLRIVSSRLGHRSGKTNERGGANLPLVDGYFNMHTTRSFHPHQRRATE